MNYKYGKEPLRLSIDDLDSGPPQDTSREITSFNILYLKSLGAKFESRKGIVDIIEEMITTYYQVIL